MWRFHIEQTNEGKYVRDSHFDGLVQDRRNSSALAMGLRLTCINSSIYIFSTSSTITFNYFQEYSFVSATTGTRKQLHCVVKNWIILRLEIRHEYTRKHIFKDTQQFTICSAPLSETTPIFPRLKIAWNAILFSYFYTWFLSGLEMYSLQWPLLVRKLTRH